MEDLETIRRRVRKLLALSKSPNESEALSALRKANELMAEHRLTQADFAVYTKSGRTLPPAQGALISFFRLLPW